MRMIKKLEDIWDWEYFITLTFSDKLVKLFKPNKYRCSAGRWNGEYWEYDYEDRMRMIIHDDTLMGLVSKGLLDGGLVRKLLNAINVYARSQIKQYYEGLIRNALDNDEKRQLRNECAHLISLRFMSYAWKYEEGGKTSRSHFHLLIKFQNIGVYGEFLDLSPNGVFNLFHNRWNYGFVDVSPAKSSKTNKVDKNMISKYLYKYFSKKNRIFKYWKNKDKRLWSTSKDVVPPAKVFTGIQYEKCCSFKEALSVNRKNKKMIRIYWEEKRRLAVRNRLRKERARRFVRNAVRLDKILRKISVRNYTRLPDSIINMDVIQMDIRRLLWKKVFIEKVDLCNEIETAYNIAIVEDTNGYDIVLELTSYGKRRLKNILKTRSNSFDKIIIKTRKKLIELQRSDWKYLIPPLISRKSDNYLLSF